VLVWAIGSSASGATAYLLPVSAGSFLYIATVSLLPEMQAECRIGRVLLQLLWMLSGAGLVALAASLPFAS
jgi:zinc and cadmium transporter